MTQKNTLLVIDGYGFVFRAFHVQPSLTTPEGKPIGAVYGFTAMLLKVLSDFKPKHAVIVFDSGKSNFRHQLYSEYKANRPPVPQELIDQFKIVRTAANSLNFSIIEFPGFEADDIIATLATKASAISEDVIIISSDKDLMQLINPHTKMYDPVKSKYITEQDVITKFGVGPDKVREVMALIGDSSDNIPGVTGIGPKTAAELIKQFGSLHELLNSVSEVKSPRQREMLETYRDKALLSWQLVGLDTEVSVPLDFKALEWTPPKAEIISEFLNEYGFKSLRKRVEQLFNLEIPITQNDFLIESNILEAIEVTEKLALSSVLEKSVESGVVGIYLAQHKNSPIALIISVAQKNYIVKILKEQVNEQGDLFAQNAEFKSSLWFDSIVLELLHNKSIKKITYNLKSLIKFFSNNIVSCDDLELMQYTVTAGLPQNNLFEAANQSANIDDIISLSAQVVGNFEAYYNKLTSELKANEGLFLYKEIDLPLCYTIDKMEREGVKIDLGILKRLSQEFGDEIILLEQQIFNEVGHEFNIGSPKQLGEVLFEKMQLPLGKLSTKSKSYSTGAEVLEKLSEMGHKIADLLLRWRGLTKLKNTYTESLQHHINPATGRINSTFLQTSTTTGRLSSNEPNLQNIPIRSIEGNKIRGVFIAKDGSKLISADYSQIELRILSHIANIGVLKEAFTKGEDIHTETALRIFKLNKEELNHEHRRKAKAINFGIIYGISSFGLSRQLNIPAKEAGSYIEKYFEEYPGIQEYMESTKIFARENGYVKNMFGRKCFVPLIKDKNHMLRQFADRAAINAPIQGSNADIIKIAMINIDKIFESKLLKTKLILQIHDELLFEAPDSEVEIVLPIIKQAMESACSLSVPLLVEAKVGKNWMEIH